MMLNAFIVRKHRNELLQVYSLCLAYVRSVQHSQKLAEADRQPCQVKHGYGCNVVAEMRYLPALMAQKVLNLPVAGRGAGNQDVTVLRSQTLGATVNGTVEKVSVSFSQPFLVFPYLFWQAGAELNYCSTIEQPPDLAVSKEGKN